VSTAEGKPNGRSLGSGNLPWASIPSLAGWHLTLRGHAPAILSSARRSRRMRLTTVGQNSDTSSADLFERLAACFG